MALAPQFRQSFTIGEGGERFLPAFAAADKVIIAASLMSLVAVWQAASWSWIAMLLTAMVSVYPALFTLTVVLTGEGAQVPATLMVGLVFVNLAFAIGGHPASAVTGRQATLAPP